MSRLVIVLLAVFTLLAGACGIALDTDPQVLEDLPQGLRPGQLPTPEPQAEVFNFQIYMVDEENNLATVGRNIALDGQATTPEAIEANAVAIVQELLLGPLREDRANGIDTAIPRDADLAAISFDPATKVARVTLTSGSFAVVVGDEQRIALAQIVYSLTARGTIDAVSFAIGEEAIPVQADSGLTERGQPVRQDDFRSLDPTAGPLVTFDDFPDDADPTETVVPDAADLDLVDIQVWMIDPAGQLVAVARRLDRTPEALLTSLAAGANAVESAAGIRSALGTEPVRVTLDRNEDSLSFRTAFVDFSADALPEVTSPDRVLALAQIVFTLTGLVEINEVALQIDGEYVAMDTIFGLAERFEPGVFPGLARTDYSPLAPEGTPLIGLDAVAVDADATAAVDGSEGDPVPTPVPTPAE